MQPAEPPSGVELLSVTGRKRAFAESQEPERRTEYTPAKKRRIDKVADATAGLYALSREEGVEDLKALLDQFQNSREALQSAIREMATDNEPHTDDQGILAYYLQNKEVLGESDVSDEIMRRRLGRVLKKMLSREEVPVSQPADAIMAPETQKVRQH